MSLSKWLAREFGEVGTLPGRFQRAEPRIKVLILGALAIIAVLVVIDLVQRL